MNEVGERTRGDESRRQGRGPEVTMNELGLPSHEYASQPRQPPEQHRSLMDWGIEEYDLFIPMQGEIRRRLSQDA